MDPPKMKGPSYTIYSTDNHAGYTLVFVMITSSIPKHLTNNDKKEGLDAVHLPCITLIPGLIS